MPPKDQPPKNSELSPLERYLSKQKAEKAAESAKVAPPKKSRLSFGNTFGSTPKTDALAAPSQKAAPSPVVPPKPTAPGKHAVDFAPNERPMLSGIERPEGWVAPPPVQPASLSRWEAVAESRLSDDESRAQELGAPAKLPPSASPLASDERPNLRGPFSQGDPVMDSVSPITNAVPTFDGQQNAEFGPRLIAAIIDGAILTALTWPARKAGLALIALAFSNSVELHREGLEYVITLATTYAYYGYFYPVKGASPGKLLIGLEVVKPDGVTRIGPWQAFFREAIGKVMSAIPFLMGYMIVMIRADHRALHDLLFDTRVIRKRV